MTGRLIDRKSKFRFWGREQHRVLGVNVNICVGSLYLGVLDTFVHILNWQLKVDATPRDAE